MGKHLLSIQELTLEEIKELIARAHYFQKIEETSPLENDSWLFFSNKQYHKSFIANLFLEPSTRTRISFEVAEKKLGLEVVNLQPSVSSMQKGESLFDTLKTLESLGIEAVVIRLQEEDLLKPLLRKLSIKIINAGEGKKAHPTQALLDFYTIQQYFSEIKGLNVAIIGDIAHSRVARSNVQLLKRMGAKLLFSGPAKYMDFSLEGNYLPIDEAIKHADVVMMLRVQFERIQGESLYPIEEYRQEFGFTEERLRNLQPHTIILHPAPVNRGIEMDDLVVEHPQSKIFEQIRHGVWIRMAVIERALGGEAKWESSFDMGKFGVKISGL
ncbi:aspartate carbamoyltransferase catalytic subunit [Tepidibacillus decaturensis]|uniref:aspartate carbamoyltransferase catalytic subunit n=1 Tax=Tepidibacillus decaturensis TaxID=1413211 RepID=UPI000837E672|nr:aspartate carbamoyltransferase catalytic subunit [Tepidibacillus decaturensis]